MEEKKRITFLLDVKEYEKLCQLAQRQRRKPNNMAGYMVRVLLRDIIR